MNMCIIPNTDLEVSRLCVGTMTFGERLDQAEADKAVAAALDHGINFFDTADIYTIAQHGISEEILGKALGQRRKEVVLATKIGGPMGPGPDDRGLGNKHMHQGVEDSLKRLHTDYVDLLYFHFPDRSVSMEEMIRSANELIEEGKIRHYGVSNYTGWEVCEMVMTAKNMGLKPPVMGQYVYNLLNRGIENEVVSMLERFELGLATFNPLAGGMLTGKYAQGAMPTGSRFDDNPGYKARYYNDKNLNATETLSRMAAELNMSVIDLAICWLLSRNHLTSVILGFSNTNQLLQNMKSLDHLDTPLPFAELDQMWKVLSGNLHPYHQ